MRGYRTCSARDDDDVTVLGRDDASGDLGALRRIGVTGDSETLRSRVESCWYPAKVVTVRQVKPLITRVFAGSLCCETVVG